MRVPDSRYQSAQVAQQQKLVYTTSSGSTIVKIDNTTVGNRTSHCFMRLAFADVDHQSVVAPPNPAADTTFGRSSVYLESLETLGLGSLVLFDAVHVPFGVRLSPPWCHSWLAFDRLRVHVRSARSGPAFSCKVPENGPQAARSTCATHVFPFRRRFYQLACDDVQFRKREQGHDQSVQSSHLPGGLYRRLHD